MYDLVVIGSGVTGYAAAMYAARLDLSVAVIGDVDGGTITLTDDVANYPGFIQLTGKELSDKLKEHALDYPVTIETGTVVDIFRDSQNFFYVVTNNKTFLAKTVLFATGMKERELEVPGHDDLRNKGVSYCALCDAPLFKDKIVAVVGGSDSAAKETLLLAKYCPKVYMIYRKAKIRPEPINARRIEADSGIEVITETNDWTGRTMVLTFLSWMVSLSQSEESPTRNSPRSLESKPTIRVRLELTAQVEPMSKVCSQREM